jgi:hypothetical protein
MTFGLTPQGFNAERLSDIVNDLEEAMIAQFGDINTSPQSVFGQIIGVMAKAYADLWENLNDVYLSQYPNSAENVSLDNVVGLNGIVRMPQTQTQVFASCFGNEGTVLPPNTLATIPNTNDIFYAPDGGTITANAADFVSIFVNTSLQPQIYSIQVNGATYLYSKPLITFTGSFVTSNSIVVNINGVSLTAVPFTTNSNTTLTAIATMIQTDPAVFTATANTGAGTIAIIPAQGFQVTVNFISITGGASQPTYAITFVTPNSVATVTRYLNALVNTSSALIGVDLMGSMTIQAASELVPFSVSVGTNLSITLLSSPVSFNAQEYGPIPCPVNALTQILTPIFGWNSVNNIVAGTTGTFQETDAQLRLRRQNSLKLQGLGTLGAIQSHLLTVSGVTAVTIFENRTLNQFAYVITFTGSILSTQTINVTYNGSSTLTVPWDTSIAATMADLAAAFLTIPSVATAVVSGGNTILTLTMNVLQNLVINSVTITGTGTFPTVAVTGGQPAKSFQCVVEGGNALDIANQIWLTKPAGIETYGNTEQDITDSQGNTQAIFFTIPVPVYIWIDVVLTLDTNPNDPFPANGILLVQSALVNYINGLITNGEQAIPPLGSGNTVFIQRVQAQIFTVPGIASAVVTTAATSALNVAPSFSNVDIPISSSQIAITNSQIVTVTD